MTVVHVSPGSRAAETWLNGRADEQFRADERVWLGGRYRLDERISLGDQVAGPAGFSREARGLSLWKATDQLLRRPVSIYLLPPRVPVTRLVIDAVQAAARVSDPRLATVYDTDFNARCPYVVTEWAPGTHLEDLVLAGLPHPALAAAMIADAADALDAARRAGLPHLRLTPRSLRWDSSRGVTITGLGLDAALRGPHPGDPARADVSALARMLYALLTGYWPGEDASALPPAPRHKGRVCTPRQVRAGVPALLDAITYRGLRGEAADAPLRTQTPAGLAVALGTVQRPSCRLDSAEENVPARAGAARSRRARHGRHRAGAGQLSTLLRPAL